MQTLNQFLQSIAGSSNKQTALHSTLESQNIAGLYKQQQTDDQFKVGSPSGSVYWTAGAPLSLLGVLPAVSYAVSHCALLCNELRRH